MVVGQLTYKFEELPLFRVGPLIAGLVEGHAVVQFNTDGGWDIKSVWLRMETLPTLREKSRSERVELTGFFAPGGTTPLSEIIAQERGEEIGEAVDKEIAETEGAR